jgi:hypothetical protein
MTDDICCIRLSESDLSKEHRDWTGNDESGDYRHHGVVRLSESPLDLRLRWKSAPGAQVKLIGCYRLNLGELLSKGFVRMEGEDTIRLQFVHHQDGGIYIRVREDMPRLRVGQFVAS